MTRAYEKQEAVNVTAPRVQSLLVSRWDPRLPYSLSEGVCVSFSRY